MRWRSWEDVSFGDAPHLGQSRFFLIFIKIFSSGCQGSLERVERSVDYAAAPEIRAISNCFTLGLLCIHTFKETYSFFAYIPCPGDSHKTKPIQISRQILVKPFLFWFTDMRDKRHVARSLAAIFKSFTPNHNQYIWSSSKLSSNLWTITPFEDRSLAITKVITPSVSKIS